MLPDSVSQTIERLLGSESIIANAATIVSAPGQTIAPPASKDPARISRYLDELATSTRGDIDAKLRIEGMLGEGGMGVVRLAEQRSLGRKVALKSLKAGARDDHAIEKMLHEAWITGLVEHPSVVPIHDIVVDAQGRPAIVLKRIEGQPWEALMFDARAVKRRFGADDLLDWNLQILAQVANAIAFAHSRGIVHRDIKPENVMIGEFGEVYVVDWGLAVAIDTETDARLPRLREVEPMAGTPAYMAPEMLGGRNAPIGRATDVYLLGAVLFELVVGMPPHTGSSLQEMIGAIVISQPEIPESVPPELARIIRRAMDPDPHARFENAVQFRLSIQGYVKHQGSRRLADEAERRKHAIERMLEVHAEGKKTDEAWLQTTYAECRFGYQQALEAWPENELARGALEDLVVKCVRYELDRGQPRVAAVMVAGFEERMHELADAVETAVRAKDRELAKLERLQRELDPETGRRTRSFLAVIVGTMWTVAPHLKRFSVFADVPEEQALALMPALFLAVGAILFAWSRESMTKTAINRFIVAFVGLVLITQILFSMAAMKLGMPAEATYSLLFLLWGLAAATIAFVAQLRMLVASLGYLVGFFVLMHDPAHRLWVSSACHGLTTLMAIAIWAPPVGPGKVLDKIDPNRNEPMATFRVSSELLFGRRDGEGDNDDDEGRS